MSNVTLDALAQRLIVDAGVAPGAVLGVAGRIRDEHRSAAFGAGSASRAGWRIETGAAGNRSTTPSGPVDETTPFDLASVTKPMVAAAVARLVRRGRLSWETPIESLVPEFEGTPSGPLPLILFVAHRAGLEAHRSLFLPLQAGEPMDREFALKTAANARRHDCSGPPPEGGFPPLYSDLGYLMAGVAASRAADVELAVLVEEEVARPLSIDVACAAAWRERDAHFVKRVAATEVVDWRGGEIAGDVHDENAWAMVGHRLAGHAGLFGTVSGVMGFGTAILDALAGRRDDWLSPAEVALLVRPRQGGTLRAGFDGRSPEGSSAGALFGKHSFGHLGFTGTSLWCDPNTDIVTVILTNRVNPSRDNTGIRAARPVLNDALYRVAAQR